MNSGSSGIPQVELNPSLFTVNLPFGFWGYSEIKRAGSQETLHVASNLPLESLPHLPSWRVLMGPYDMSCSNLVYQPQSPEKRAVGVSWEPGGIFRDCRQRRSTGHWWQQRGNFSLGIGQYSRECFLLCQGGPGPESNKTATVGLPNSPSAPGEKGHGAEAGIQAINPLFKE